MFINKKILDFFQLYILNSLITNVLLCIANDESTTNQGECLPIQSMSFYGSSSASNSSG